MGTRKTPISDGILIPERCQASALADVGAGATDSSYGEATPRPGLCIAGDAWSQLNLEVRNQQGTDIDVQVIKSGAPARDGVQLAIKKDSEATASWRGWNGFQMLNGFIPIDWGNTGSLRHDACTIPSTQKVAIAYRTDSSTAEIAVIDTDHSVTLASASVADGTDWNYPAIVCLPGSERLLLFYGGSSYYSDDLGETWSTLGDGITSETTTTYGHTSVCEYRGDLVMFVEDTSTPETIHHLVSTDGGATFNLVSSVASLGVRVTCCSNEDGIHVAWVDTGVALEYRKLGTAFEPLDTVSQTVISSSVVFEESCIWSDGGGTLYILAGGWEAWVYESLDAGESWSAAYQCATIRHGDSNDKMGYFRAAYALGQAFVMAAWFNGSSWVTDKNAALVLGGWSNLVLTVNAAQKHFPKNRWGFGNRSGSSNADGETFAPFAGPATQGWTGSGAGTGSLGTGAWNIVTSASKLSYSVNVGSVTGLVALLEVQQVSGGSSSTQDIAATFRLADASTFEYEAEILFTSTGFTVNDINSAATGSATVDMTAFVQLLVWINTEDEAIVVRYRSAGETIWTAGATVSLTDAGATANSGRVQWGNIATATAESNWRMVHYCSATDELPELTSSIAAMLGKSFNSRGEPIPEMGTSTGAAFLAATSGPGRAGDTFDIDAWYEHGIEQCHVEVSPAPSATWRSADLTEQTAVYDLGANGWVGHAIALVVRGANFRTIYLESYDGSSWDTEATLDLAQDFGESNPFEYTLTGDTMYPDLTNTNAADRWLWEQELRDGWVIANASGGPTTDATRIVSQSSGGWQTTAAGTTVIPMLRLNDVSSISAHSGTKNAILVHPDGMAIKYLTSVKARRYWRWRIAAGTANEDTPDNESYYEAGMIAICRVVAMGDLTTWGNREQTTPNTAYTQDRAGTLRADNKGDEQRRWQLGWAQGPNNMSNLREGPDADYIGPTTGLALAGAEDVYHLLRGVYRITDGGQLPIVAVRQLPDADATITDPTRFLVGHLRGPLGATQNSGQAYGTSEVERIDSISIEELVD